MELKDYDGAADARRQRIASRSRRPSSTTCTCTPTSCQVIGDVVSLKRSGATWKGLCPFHGEKTPSFHVNREKGFFHCFGCHVGGDVIKFVELHEKVSFPEAVRMLAAPVRAGDARGRRDARRAAPARRSARRCSRCTRMAAAWFRAQLARRRQAPGCASSSTRAASARRPSRTLGLGFAPSTRDGAEGASHRAQASSCRCCCAAGLVVQRDNGEVVDRFRGRLMIPICRDAGSVIAFGGRATEADQVPKYLNSPETPIYSKSRTLYGLNLTEGGDPEAELRDSGRGLLRRRAAACRPASRRWSPRAARR